MMLGYKQAGLLLSILLFWTSAASASSDLSIETEDGGSYKMYDKSEALLILEQNYSAENGGFNNLPGVSAEGEQVKNALESQHFSVTVLRDLKSADLVTKIGGFLMQTRDNNERILLFFAGHGDTYVDPATHEVIGYIIPLDAPTQTRDLSSFRQKALSMAKIRTFAEHSTGRHTLLVFDSCFSSSIFEVRSGFKPTSFSSLDSLHKRAVEVLTASDLPVSDQSAFGPAFVDAIKGAAPHSRSFVRFGEVGVYVQDRVLDDRRHSGTPAAGFLPPSSGEMVFVPSANQMASDTRTADDRAKSEKVRNMFAGYSVRYFRKMGDSPKIADALSEARIPFSMPPAQLSQVDHPLSINMVACHPATDIALVKKIVETLMDNGVSVRAIGQFQKNVEQKRKNIEILTGLRHQGSPLTREQVETLQSCPVNLEN